MSSGVKIDPNGKVSGGNGSVSGNSSVPQGSNGNLSLPRPHAGYELKKLRENHHLILRLAALGKFTNKEIADMVGATEAAVGYTINCELGQQKLAVLRGEADLSVIDVMEEYNQLAPLAVEVMESIMMSPGEKATDRLRAAENIVGGAGYGKRERVDIYQHGISDSDIEEARKLSREKAKSAGIVIEDAKVISESKDNV